MGTPSPTRRTRVAPANGTGATRTRGPAQGDDDLKSNEDPVALLSDRHSDKRRRGARALRRSGEPAAGPALLSALQHEVRTNLRGWETQYHLVMALLAVGHQPARPYLEELLQPDAGVAPLVRVAAAEARVGLDDAPVEAFLRLVRAGDEHVRKGALRAAARQRLRLEATTARAVIDQVAPAVCTGEQDDACLCLVVACAGWPPEVRGALLETARRSSWDELRAAAERAARDEYAAVVVL